MWAGPAQTTGPGINPENSGPILAQNGWADLGPKYFWGRAGPRPETWAGPTLARPKGNVNYLQNMNSGSRSACNQNGCRKWKMVEERLTRSRSLGRDQEA
jgi:hypothetical protein